MMSQSIAVPNTYGGTEGNSRSAFPFALSGVTARYQQVYDASQFSLATNGGWIYHLDFRPDGGSPSFYATVTNVEIHFSTTLRSPDRLSPIFSENIGSNDTLVFSGSFALGSLGAASPQPWYFNVGLNEVTFSKYFWYNPAVGNLLMDVRVYESASGGTLDAADTPGDGVSRVYAVPVDSTSGTTDSVGLVTLITMAPVPSLTASISNLGTTTNSIVIRWPTQPTTFVLQESSSLDSNAVWQNLPAVGGSNVVFKEYRIPVSSAGSNTFFRLAGPAP
jgi:hypothetical protein